MREGDGVVFGGFWMQGNKSEGQLRTSFVEVTPSGTG